jgi:hypothetical protein
VSRVHLTFARVDAFAVQGLGMRRYSPHVRSLAALAAFTGATAAHAAEFNYENFRFGDRALGMGGAVTAVPGQAESSFYNPAGFALLNGTQLSASLHFTGFDHRRIREGFFFAIFDEDDELLAGRDEILTSDGYLPIPISSVISWTRGNHHFGFSTFLTNEAQESYQRRLSLRGEEFAGIADSATAEYTYARSETDRLVLTGPSWAYSLSDSFHIGASAFLARRDFNRTNTLSVREDQTGNGAYDLDFASNAVVSYTDHSLLFRLGMLWQAADWLTFGLNLSTQSFSLHSSGQILVSYNEVGQPSFAANYRDLEAGAVQPWSLTLGTAINTPSVILSLDVAHYFYTEYDRLYGGGINRELERQAGIPLFIERDNVTNLRFGVEFRPESTFPIRLGAYTNFTATDLSLKDEEFEVGEPALPNPVQTGIDLYGVTAGFGYRRGGQEFHAGVNMEIGISGMDTAYHDIRDPSLGYISAYRDEVRVIFFFAGKLDFVERLRGAYEDVRDGVNRVQDQYRDTRDRVNDGIQDMRNRDW